MSNNIPLIHDQDSLNPDVIYNSGQACCCPLEVILGHLIFLGSS